VREATPRQLEVLDFIRERIETTALPPTIREIAKHFGWPTVGAAVVDHLRALERKGLIVHPKGKCRAIQIVAHPRRIWVARAEPVTQDSIDHWIPAIKETL
jgi:repressor LexA